jgi:tetratricopeptide (TPR) repeat protein
VLPALTGFALVGSREVTEVTIAGLGGPVRTTTRELRLRAGRPGTVAIGAVRVRQGGREVATAPILVTVDSAVAELATGLSPIARSLLEGAPPPAHNDRVELTVIIPGDSVLLGQQVDVVAAAWFPRELHTRLRRAPIITMQTPEGVWAYPGAAPSGSAATRLVRGRWMDLFVAHQAVFPLAVGRLTIPPATVEYAVPVTFSFFSREDRYSLRSDSVAVTVLPLPAARRSAGDPGVVAQGLGVDVAVEPAACRVGEPIEATALVRGVGNVALWPEPTIPWPPGFRAYPSETETRIESRDGRIAGIRMFHYLVVPDSAGSFVLAEVRYPYYDVAAGVYMVASAAPRAVAVAPGAEPRPARALPPLLPDRTPAWGDAVARDLTPWGWLVLLVGPPLLAWLWRRRGATESAAAAAAASLAPAAPRRGTALGRLEGDFQAVLASHVPDLHARDGDGLARALRAAGVESAVADHIVRLRDRLRAARYGPGGRADAAGLATELRQVLRVLGAEPSGKRHRVVAAIALIALTALARAGAAQGPSAEALYEAGALRAAADSFAARASADPRVPAHWYNLGATLYRAGADGKAIAAWTRAARLAPRDRILRHARALLPAPDAASEPLVASGVATPPEWALAAAGLWLA